MHRIYLVSSNGQSVWSFLPCMNGMKILVQWNALNVLFTSLNPLISISEHVNGLKSCMILSMQYIATSSSYSHASRSPYSSLQCMYAPFVMETVYQPAHCVLNYFLEFLLSISWKSLYEIFWGSGFHLLE